MGFLLDSRGIQVGSTGRGKEDEHYARDHAQKHGLFAAHHRASWRTRRSHMSYLCPHCNSFLLEDYVWWVSAGKKYTSWWCAICGEKHNWKQPNGLLVVQTRERVEQAKVFKAHAARQGLCANLINALKLLTNQQEDGDGLLQKIVKELGKSRKYLSNGMREFTKVDNERALKCWILKPGHEAISSTKAESARRVPGGDKCRPH